MGSSVELTASDGHQLDMYLAMPEGTPKGAVLICPEIFGINSHIRAVADEYAKAGYIVGAPALFDRVQRKYEAGYERSDVEAGIAIMQQIVMADALDDTHAGIEYLRQLHPKVAVIGYCWGGTVAWVSAAHLPYLNAVVAYYPGGLIANAELKPQCPTMLHLGEHDPNPPADAVRTVMAEHPTVMTYFYDAGHGFNCDQRPSYAKDAVKTATERTLAFLDLNAARWMIA